MNKQHTVVESEFNGALIKLETGKIAIQADSAVVATVGDTTVLVTVVSKPSSDETDFLPLRIDYEERYYAGGILSGSRYTRREGRPTDEAIVHGRLIDHAIRPLFPKDFKDEVQIIVTILTSDMRHSPILAGFLGVSAALSISGLPFKGPIVPLRISKVGENFEYGLTVEAEESLMDLVVSYLENGKKIQALEAHADIVPEEIVVNAIKAGGKVVSPLFDLLQEFKSKNDVVEKPYKSSWLNKEIISELEKPTMDVINESLNLGFQYNDKSWNEKLDNLVKTLEENKYKDIYTAPQIRAIIDEVQKDWVRNIVLKNNSRIDGRKDDEIRELSAEVAILPRVHGSAFFKRGLSHSLTIATLGPIAERLVVQGMHGEQKKRYIHHYNFPPYSTGEIGRVGGANRREVGHGMLAEKALVPVLPSEEDFPYAIRLVSEIVSSNGSTSMAATCGSTLALMDAGVPIKAPVAGIGVGVFIDKTNENPQLSDYKFLTDIMGVEDFAGFMDFKLTGTKDGMTAIQLELKLQGLPIELVDKMFEISKTARLQVLQVMESAISAPREKLGKYVPKIDVVKIAKDQIGMIIGSGGATIRGIMEATGTQIDVEEVVDGGLVSISAEDEESLKKAKEIIMNMTKEIKVGEIYEGEVVRLEPYGAFVQLAPKQDGLLHVSELSYDYVDDIRNHVKLGDKITAKVISMDNGKISLSAKALMEKPEGYIEKERPQMQRSPQRRDMRQNYHRR